MMTTSRFKRLYKLLPDELTLALMAEYPYFDNKTLAEKYGLSACQIENFAYIRQLRKDKVMLSARCSIHSQNIWKQKKIDPSFYSKERKKHESKGWYCRTRSCTTIGGVYVRGSLRAAWTKHFGPIPANMAIWVKDWNRDNLDPENLMLVTRAELNCYVQAKKQPRELWDMCAALYLLRLRIKTSEQKQA